MSRTLSTVPTDARASTPAIRTGSTAPGRFRSLGDGQVDFGAVFSKFTQYDYPGWAVLEWEDCIKNGEDGAKEGAIFIEKHLIRVADRAFDDFAGGVADAEANRKLLGL